MAMSPATPTTTGTVRGCCTRGEEEETCYTEPACSPLFFVGPLVKPIGKPDAGNRPVRFDERGQETECCHMAQATAPVLDLYEAVVVNGEFRGV